MKGKIFLCVIIIALLIFSIFILMQNNAEEVITEYTPEEEISEEQTRKTLVTLYFQNKETNDIMPEARLVDAKILISNPYESLINLLLEGPKNDKLKSVIPVKTKLNKVYLEGNTAVVDFSIEFIEDINLGAEEENKIVYSIVNTLTELTEIDSVKILIDGQEGCAFEDKAINFKSVFVRI